jgi:hypothetical protein
MLLEAKYNYNKPYKIKILIETIKGGLKKMVTGYCLKCKKKDTEMKDARIEKTSRGGFIAKGQCNKCGTNMAGIKSKENAEKAVKEGAKKAY